MTMCIRLLGLGAKKKAWNALVLCYRQIFLDTRTALNRFIRRLQATEFGPTWAQMREVRERIDGVNTNGVTAIFMFCFCQEVPFGTPIKFMRL